MQPNSLDLNLVSAKLLQVSAEKISAPESPNSPSPGRTPPSHSPSTPLLPEELYIQDINYEKRFYGKLLKHGGRPWYPVERIEEVSKNPREHSDLLLYWRGNFPESKPDNWQVFEPQYKRWKEFRQYQIRMRKKAENDMSSYLARCKGQLAQHSITRPFELEKDPLDQDKLVTWIEYLSFEYSRYKRHSWYKRREQQYEEAWKKLVSSKVLKPQETRDYIESARCASDYEAQSTQLRQAVEAARSNLLLAERDALNPALKPSIAHGRLFKSQTELDSTIRTYDSFKRRNDAIYTFRRTTASYRDARRAAQRHDILLRWAREQIPLIEQEMGLPPYVEDETSEDQDEQDDLQGVRSGDEGDDESDAKSDGAGQDGESYPLSGNMDIDLSDQRLKRGLDASVDEFEGKRSKRDEVVQRTRRHSG